MPEDKLYEELDTIFLALSMARNNTDILCELLHFQSLILKEQIFKL